MRLAKVATALLLLGLAACSTSPSTDWTPPWLVGQAGGPFPYNSAYCP